MVHLPVRSLCGHFHVFRYMAKPKILFKSISYRALYSHLSTTCKPPTSKSVCRHPDPSPHSAPNRPWSPAASRLIAPSTIPLPYRHTYQKWGPVCLPLEPAFRVGTSTPLLLLSTARVRAALVLKDVQISCAPQHTLHYLKHARCRCRSIQYASLRSRGKSEYSVRHKTLPTTIAIIVIALRDQSSRSVCARVGMPAHSGLPSILQWHMILWKIVRHARCSTSR